MTRAKSENKTLPALTVIPAGAGSGKTYTIQTTLGKWVQEGLVRPERIVAVTFTEAAASELRERIRAQLVSDGRMDDALKLNQAYISTIHGFGLRLLGQYALDAGLNPRPRKLDENEELLLIRRALARGREADTVLKNLGRFGYAYDFNSGEAASGQFRAEILKLVNMLRTIAPITDVKAAKDYLERHLRKLYGKTGKESDFNNRLSKAAEALLKAFPNSMVAQGRSQAAKKNLARDFRNLQAVGRGEQQYDWNLWQQLRDCVVSSGHTKLPEDYDELAKRVIDAANALPQHPGPLNHAITHMTQLLGASQEALQSYSEDKSAGGLLDYTDMLFLPLLMLEQKDEVLQAFVSGVDCLIIDEFQDTNPLQFALLWRMQAAGVPTLIVGDLKQAIMGFQHADPRLMEALMVQHRKALAPLTGNWRSTPEIMAFVNAVGAGLFGKDYTALAPQVKHKSQLSALEVIHYPKYSRSHAPSAQHTVARLRDLLAEGKQVRDRHSGALRPLRAGDIAILCRTNARMQPYAKALRQMGLRCRLPEDGWLGTREVQLAHYLLSWVADPGEDHATLYLAATELGAHTLESALKQHMDKCAIAEPLLERLEAVRARAATGSAADSVPELLRDTLETVDLYGTVANWPNARQARANLLRLEGEAQTFAQANRDALESGGFYGSSLKTFLAWLAAKVAQEGDAQPEPRVLDEDAVEIVTWHSAKGREWPVVVVAATNNDVEPRLPAMGIHYEDFSDLGGVLDKARVLAYPDFAAPETREAFQEQLTDKEQLEARRLLYVALTRPRECLILEWHSHQDKKDCSGNKTSLYRLLKDSAQMRLEGNRLHVSGQSFACRVTEGSHEAHPDFEGLEEKHGEPLPEYGRRALKSAPLPEALTPEFITPSALAHEAPPQKSPKAPPVETYGKTLALGLDLPPAERGVLLHRCFEALGAHPDVAARLDEATGHAFTDAQREALATAANGFETWLRDTLAPASVLREVPFLAANRAGSVISGVMDLLMETDDGFWIIDHKSDETDDPAERFATYREQLAAYAQAVALARPDKPVRGVGIHWIARGAVTREVVGRG